MIIEPPEKPFFSGSSTRPRGGGRTILFAGVAGACVLGAGLGLWARPAMHERQAAASAPPDAVEAVPTTERQLRIVVGDRPPAATAPIEVLQRAAAPPPEPFLGPVRPPQGLIRARDVSPPTAAPRPLITSEAVRAVGPAISRVIAATSLAIARAEAPPAVRLTSGPAKPVRLAEAEPAPHAPPPARVQAAKVQVAKVQAAKVQVAKVEAAKVQAAQARTARIQLAKAEAAKAHAARLQLAKVQAAKAAAHRLELAKAAKAEKAEQIRLAEAEARGRAEARAQARQEALADSHKRARLAALAHVLSRALPHRARPEPVEVAAVSHRRGHKGGHEPQVQQASLKTRRGREPARLAAAHPARARPAPPAPQPGAGLMKVSTTPRCARSDPGEALVCADPSLGAADRQLSRAYQGARAAGVPDAELRSQQMRWLAARSAAAREAPWAVRDVYMARIAELNGQAKDARDGY